MEDFSFQGKVYLGANLAGKPQAMRWVNDAAVLQLNVSSSEEKRKESYSGNRLTSATLQTGIEVGFSLTLNHATVENLALGMYGTNNSVVAASITGETLPDGLVAGDLVVLDRANISALSIEDSAGTPAALTLDTHYAIDDAIGAILSILDVTGFTQPFVASYDHGASEDITMFTASAPVRYLTMVGKNTVDGSTDKLRVHLYKLKFNPVSQFDLINSAFGELALTGTCILDTNNEPDATLGGYGRLELLG